MNIGKRHLNEADFDILWASIHHELYKLFCDSKCSALVIYNNIYIICTAPQSKFVETLYWKLGDFIYERAREMRAVIYKAEEWIPEYNAGFRKFKYYVSCMNELCDFLSQYISAKSLDVFAYVLWERCILQTTKKYKGTTLGLALVESSKEEDVKEAIESLRCIVVDGKNPLLYYVQKYEQYALERIKRRYDQRREKCSIEEYARYVYETVRDQREKREKIFLKESYEKLDLILEDQLVTQKKKYIQSEVFRILNRHKLPVQILDTIRNSGCVGRNSRDNGRNVGDSRNVGNKHTHTTHNKHHTHHHPLNDFYSLYLPSTPGKVYTLSSDVLVEVSRVFKYLRVIRNSYELMKMVLVKYITTQLETHFHLLDRRIETLYVFYCMFKNVVEVGFDSDEGCFRVFEEKFSEVLNRLKPSLSSRLIDFSSSIVHNDSLIFPQISSDVCDERNDVYEKSDVNNVVYPSTYPPPTISHPTTYRDGALLRVFSSLFGLLEDKDDFAERYIYEMAKRLVGGTTDFQKEKLLVNIIKGGCTSDSIRKAEIMLSDISTSISTISSHFYILTQCAWPLEFSPYSITLPPFFSTVIQEEEQRHPKKKLSWLWEFSTIYLEIDGVEIRTNLLQYIVLDLFNTTQALTKEEISRRTSLTGKTLEWTILSLLRSDILLVHEDRYELSTCTKTNPYDYFIKENLFMDHQVNRLIYYQSFISNTLKKHKELSFSCLYSRVVSGHTERFPLDCDELYKGIKGLLEKGILEEESGESGGERTFKYVP